MHERLHLKITGRVQGVFYRATTHEQALRLGLVGWVRNMPDGSVELCAEGPREVLEQLLEWCRQGPPGARVSGVRPSWSEATGEHQRFAVRY